MDKTLTIFLALSVTAASLVGCSEKTKTYRTGNYRTIEVEPDRDIEAARRYNVRGLKHLEDEKLDDAAAEFRRALVADVKFGPAHNNLGKVLYFEQDWYNAAWEFEYARDLMPRQAEPLNNLGLVHERVGELDRAIENYEKAVALAPDSIEFRGNLARAKVRRGDSDAQLIALLQQIVSQDKRPEWITWAKAILLRLEAQR